jgi:hypothetical protein
MTLKWKDSTKYLGVKEGTVTERWIEIESLIERLNVFENELLNVVDDCVSSWSNIEKEYKLKFSELREELEHLKEVN